MEEEIIKELENVTNLYILPAITKVVVIRLGLIMTKEEFTKFQAWLISKGFSDIRPEGDDMMSLLFMGVNHDNKRHRVRYNHVDGKKVVYIVYTADDVVKVESVIYFEES